MKAKTSRPPAAPAFLWGPALAFLAPALLYLPILGHELVNWDDNKNLVENFHYRGLGPAQLDWIFRGSFGFMGNYEPVHWLGMAAAYAWGGMKPSGYHAVALACHAAASAVFCLIALRLLKAAFREEASPSLQASALFASLAFALHPLRLESVAWVSGQHYAEAGLFYLLSVLWHLKALDAGAGRAFWRAASLAAFALSLLCLPIGMTLPLALLLLDLYPLRRWNAAEKLPYLVLAAAGAGLGLWAKKAGGFLLATAQHGLAERLAVSAYGLAYYLGKTLWPAGLYPDHELVDRLSLAEPMFRSAAVFAALTAAGAVWLWRRGRPAALAAWAYYALTLLPVLGLVQSGQQLVADRYTYLACLGWALAAGGGLYALAKRGRAAFAAAALAAAALAGVSLDYMKAWRNSETLWTRALAHDDRLRRAHNNLGNAYALQGRFDEAVAQYEAVLRLDPKEAESWYNLGNALVVKGRVAEGVERYRRALELNPQHLKAYSGLGNALRLQGKLPEAIEALRRGLELDPGNFGTHNNLGIALAAAGRMEEAAGEFRESLRLNPGYAQAQSNLKLALARLAGGSLSPASAGTAVLPPRQGRPSP